MSFVGDKDTDGEVEGGRVMERGQMNRERRKGGRRSDLEINTNRRWAWSHQQQVNLSKEQERPGGNESPNPPYVTRCCCLMLFNPYCSTFTFTLGRSLGR